MKTPLWLVPLVVLPNLLACTGLALDGGSSGADTYGDLTYKRFKNLDQVEILDFVSEEKVQIFYSGRFDDRKTRVGTWTQSGSEVVLELEPLEGYEEPHSIRVNLRQTGRCSLALYHRDKTDGSTWASGEPDDEGDTLVQPTLFEQKWPPCERY